MVNVLESTLEWTKGEVIVSVDMGSHDSHTPCFSLDSASAGPVMEKSSSAGSEFLKALISEHGRFFVMFLKRDKSCN